jgi:polysaccharide biosynthesis/export protein
MNKLIWVNCKRFCILISLMVTTSCVPYHMMKYFNDINETIEPVSNPQKSATISPFDKLNVFVLSTDEKTSAILNYSGQTNSGIRDGLVVDETGNINYPFVGKINVNGLTLQQVGDTLSNAISSIITNPVVRVSFMDNRITVIGEVQNQGTYLITKDNISIYESLALGGGLTQYADRKNIILLRNENNKMLNYKLDLTNSKIASNPHYYIMRNDIIVVEPIRFKTWSIKSSSLTTILSTISFILTIYYVTTFRVAK